MYNKTKTAFDRSSSRTSVSATAAPAAKKSNNSNKQPPPDKKIIVKLRLQYKNLPRQSTLQNRPLPHSLYPPMMAPIWAPAITNPYEALAPSRSTVALVNAQNSATASDPYDSMATKDTQPTTRAGLVPQLVSPSGAVRRTRLTSTKSVV